MTTEKVHNDIKTLQQKKFENSQQNEKLTTTFLP